MKLEVGKKYVDGNGHIFEIVSEHCGEFFGVTHDAKISSHIFYKDGKARRGFSTEENNLVSEHIEPRTKDVWVGFFYADFQKTKAVAFEESRYIDAHANGTEWVVIGKKKITLTEGQFDE